MAHSARTSKYRQALARHPSSVPFTPQLRFFESRESTESTEYDVCPGRLVHCIVLRKLVVDPASCPVSVVISWSISCKIFLIESKNESNKTARSIYAPQITRARPPYMD